MEHIPLGKPAQPGAKRDAVHIAIIAARTGGRASPGQRMRIVSDGHGGHVAKTPEPGDAGNAILDPWLEEDIEQGVDAWVLMDPNTITGLRHRWEHPEVEPDTETGPWAKDLVRSMSDVEDAKEADMESEIARAWIGRFTGVRTDEELDEIVRQAVQGHKEQGVFVYQGGDPNTSGKVLGRVRSDPDDWIWSEENQRRFWRCVAILTGDRTNTSREDADLPFRCCM